MNLNLDDDEGQQPPSSPQDIKYDLGPHIKRLPDELIPAIQKFLIIAKTSVVLVTAGQEDDGVLPTHQAEEISLLVQCLTIIGRHFDNINLIIRSNFINSTVEICHHLLNVCSAKRLLSGDEQRLIQVCCEFLELIYDPFLTWRHFARTHRLATAGGGSSSYHVDPQLHPEIVPFVYTCFEARVPSKWSALRALGASLLNVLGAITSGSLRNGRLVICPATINVIVKLLGDWQVDAGVRRKALANANLMLVTLSKSSPVERQVEVDIVVQEYLLAMQQLLRTYPISAGDDSEGDTRALLAIVQNMATLLCEPSTKASLCNALLDGGVLTQLVEVPGKIQDWATVDMDEHLSAVVEVVALVSYSANYRLPEKMMTRLFQGLRRSASPSSSQQDSRKGVVLQCLGLATSPNDALVVDSRVVNELVRWLPDLSGDEQALVIASLMDVCTRNSNR